MFGFGKKKKEENVSVEEPHVPKGMKETAERMMAGYFDMNDMLAQLKQIKKMSNFSGLLKMVPGMKDAVAAMKEKIADGNQYVQNQEKENADQKNDQKKSSSATGMKTGESPGVFRCQGE